MNHETIFGSREWRVDAVSRESKIWDRESRAQSQYSWESRVRKGVEGREVGVMSCEFGLENQRLKVES